MKRNGGSYAGYVCVGGGVEISGNEISWRKFIKQAKHTLMA